MPPIGARNKFRLIFACRVNCIWVLIFFHGSKLTILGQILAHSNTCKKKVKVIFFLVQIHIYIRFHPRKHIFSQVSMTLILDNFSHKMMARPRMLSYLEVICDTIKRNESLVENFNFYFLQHFLKTWKCFFLMQTLLQLDMVTELWRFWQR